MGGGKKTSPVLAAWRKTPYSIPVGKRKWFAGACGLQERGGEEDSNRLVDASGINAHKTNRRKNVQETDGTCSSSVLHGNGNRACR